MTISTSRIPTAWQHGAKRAQARHIKACRCKGGRCYRVPSGSGHGAYLIHLLGGKIGPCQCEASRRHGPAYVCAHRGAVLIAELFFRNIRVQEGAA